MGYGTGYPLFNIDCTRIEGDTLGILIQTTTSDKVTLFTTPLEFRISFESGQAKIFRLQQTQNDQYFKVPAREKVAGIRFDPNSWLIKRL